MPKTKLVYDLTRNLCVCVSELADGPLLRMRGLIGREGLPSGEGLLLTPAPAIHTAFMRFPIDALFLDRQLRVLDIVEHLRPWHVASKRGSRSVLELAAGECARLELAVGDELELRERKPQIEAPLAAVTADFATDAGAPALPASGRSSGAGGEAQLASLRVLVVSRDRRFRAVIGVLLARQGCSVTTTADLESLVKVALTESASVVVIDTAHPGWADALLSMRALPRRPGVVLAADEARQHPDAERLVTKWGPFEDLLIAIEDAGDAWNRGGGDDGLN